MSYVVMTSGPKRNRSFWGEIGLPSGATETITNNPYGSWIEAMEKAVNSNNCEYVWVYSPDQDLLWRFHN